MAALPDDFTLPAYPQLDFCTDKAEKDLYIRRFQSMKLPGDSQKGNDNGGSKLPPLGAPLRPDEPSFKHNWGPEPNWNDPAARK